MLSEILSSFRQDLFQIFEAAGSKNQKLSIQIYFIPLFSKSLKIQIECLFWVYLQFSAVHGGFCRVILRPLLISFRALLTHV